MQNDRIALFAGIAAFAMLTLAFASKPLYDTFCRVTGYGGTTQTAKSAPKEILDREMVIRFDANVADAPLMFRPLQDEFRINVGEHALAQYEVTNTSGTDISVIANYNVTPHTAGRFFVKQECFCFETRIIPAGETRTLPVIFFVDPTISEERGLSFLKTITLSYTFFETDNFPGAAKTASLD